MLEKIGEEIVGDVRAAPSFDRFAPIPDHGRSIGSALLRSEFDPVT
jgi:hypothetical protein